jgi:hypothetical protein
VLISIDLQSFSGAGPRLRAAIEAGRRVPSCMPAARRDDAVGAIPRQRIAGASITCRACR